MGTKTGNGTRGMNSQQRQFVNFGFFKVRPEWRFLSEKEKARGRKEALDAAKACSKNMIMLTYSLVGIRADCDFLLWRVSYRLEDFQEMITEIFKTGFGKYMVPAYSYLAMTRRSVYVDKISPEHQEERTKIVPGKFNYLFVYPFVKTREWYQLPLDKRQEMMDSHIRIGTKYPSVKLNTTYSFGLDDQEFVVAFETNSPSDFLDLVMELRESPASKYTLRDTPTFTCILKPFEKLLEDF